MYKICIFVLIVFQLNLNTCVHIHDKFQVNDFFKFIVKFGFQKTERHSQRDSFGYIFGNITSKDNLPFNKLTFAVMDKSTFFEFYNNRTIVNKDLACQKMFQTLNHTAYDSDCNPKATGDFLRKVPCKINQLCVDEDFPSNVIKGSQFTYVISDLMQPRFWYISLTSCYRNTTTCQWHHYDFSKSNEIKIPEIEYDFQLVNGDPNHTTFNLFVFHFSFDQQNIFEMYLIFFFIYLILVPLQIYAVRIQKHFITKLFTMSLMLEFISLCFILIYMIRYALKGSGNENLKILGDVFDVFSRTSFMLILLLLSKGWAITRQEISRSGWLILMLIWIPYCCFHVFLYVWNRTEVDIISDVDEYQTWPGWLNIASRSAIMLWFLWELRNTMTYEHSSKKLDFLLHFGASSLVWFCYLPVAAAISLQVSPLWRYKLLLGIINSADCLAYCLLTGLLWPNRSGQYLLLLGGGPNGMDELDEFNEAPHIIHHTNETLQNHHRLPVTNNEIDSAYDRNSLINGDISTDLLNEDDLIVDDDDILGYHRYGDTINLDKNSRINA